MSTQEQPGGEGLSDNFHTYMETAQRLHSQGRFLEAVPLWGAATELAHDAEDPLNEGRALRGRGVSADRGGHHVVGREYIKMAYQLHDSLVRESDEPTPEQYTERVESARVFGRQVIDVVVDSERAGLIDVELARELASSGLDLIEQAKGDDIQYILQTGEIHQHSRNIPYLSAFFHSLYGDRKAGKEDAGAAIMTGLKAESKRSPHSAHISLKHRWTMKAVYTARGVAAKAVNLLSTDKPTRRRNAALGIYKKVA